MGKELVSGSLIVDGNLKMEATRVGKESTLSQIIQLVKKLKLTSPIFSN